MEKIKNIFTTNNSDKILCEYNNNENLNLVDFDYTVGNEKYTVLPETITGEFYDYYLSNDKNIFKDTIKNILPSFDKTKIKFILIDQKNEFIRFDNIFDWQSDTGHKTIFGFHYWSYKFDPCKKLNLLAVIDNTVIGCIKFGEYGFKDDMHIGVAFIDVHMFYRNKGVSKLLWNEFFRIIDNIYFNKYKEIRISRESILGKKYHQMNIAMKASEISKIKII